MTWKYLDDILLKLSKNSTVFGKFWVLSILLFRLLVLTSFGEHIWSDEQREFTCNTKQPGCENVCFNIFTPVSNVRLWGLQTLAVSVPGAFYFLYVLHVMSQKKFSRSKSFRHTEEDEDPDDMEETYRSHRKRRKLLSEHVIPPEIDRSRVQFVWKLYLLQIILRAVLECLFALLQYKVYFYKWTVPEVFACSRWPCPHTVDCFISRPREKTVFFRYMFAVSGLSLVICMIELFFITWSGIRDACHSENSCDSRSFTTKTLMNSASNTCIMPKCCWKKNTSRKTTQHSINIKENSNYCKMDNSSEIVFAETKNDTKLSDQVSYV